MIVLTYLLPRGKLSVMASALSVPGGEKGKVPDEEDCGTGSGSWEASVQLPLYGQGESNPRTTVPQVECCGRSEPVHGDPSAG